MNNFATTPVTSSATPSSTPSIPEIESPESPILPKDTTGATVVIVGKSKPRKTAKTTKVAKERKPRTKQTKHVPVPAISVAPAQTADTTVPFANGEVKTRRCACCGETKPLTREHFYYDFTNNSGFQYGCIKCKSEYNKAKYSSRVKSHTTSAQTSAKSSTAIPTVNITRISDAALFAEIRRRGYTGDLSVTKHVAI